MKRGYKDVSVTAREEGYGVTLDAAPLRTPLGKELLVPSSHLAEAIAAEWRAQEGTVDKDGMKTTQLACIALDLAHEKRDLVIKEILEYAATDLVCYRAGHEPELAGQQEEILAPIVAWAETFLSIRLQLTGGIMPVAQPPENDSAIDAYCSRLNVWELALLAFVTKPLGSAILGIAFLEKQCGAADGFTLSHLEETFETKKWGEDGEKAAKLRATLSDLAAAEAFRSLLKNEISHGTKH